MRIRPHQYKFFLFVLTFACMVFSACTGTRDLSVVNLSNVYRNADHLFHPEFRIVHQTDSTSLLLVRLNTREFLFSRQNDDRFNAFFTVRYRLAEAYESINVVLDSGSVPFTITEEEKNRKLIYEVPFRLPKKSEM